MHAIHGEHKKKVKPRNRGRMAIGIRLQRGQCRIRYASVPRANWRSGRPFLFIKNTRGNSDFLVTWRTICFVHDTSLASEEFRLSNKVFDHIKLWICVLVFITENAISLMQRQNKKNNQALLKIIQTVSFYRKFNGRRARFV